MVPPWCVTVAEAQTKIREPVGEGLHTHVKAGREVFEKIIVVNIDGSSDEGVDHGPWHQELRGKLICFDLLTDLGSAGALVTEVERDTPVHVFGDVLVEQQVPSAFDIHHRRSGKIDRVGEILLAQPRLPLAAYRGGAGSRSVGPARAGRTLPPVRSRSGASAGTRRWSRRSRSATAAPANTKSGAPRSPARGTDDGRRGTRRRRHD